MGGYFAVSLGAARPDDSRPACSPSAGSLSADSPSACSSSGGSPSAGLVPAGLVPAGLVPAGWQSAVLAYQQGMADRAAQMGLVLGTREERVAVSTLQLDYAARLWSPALACALVHGIVPDLGGLEIAAGLPPRLRLPVAAGWRSPDSGPELAGLLYRVVVTGHLEPLAAGLRGQVASGLLWGNAASAMIGSLTVLASARPGIAGAARSIASQLLGIGMLRETGQLTGPALEFRRNSCCLYYRVPGSGLCGDCSLRDGEH